MTASPPRSPRAAQTHAGRLFLEISGQSYSLRAVHCDDRIGHRAYRLLKADGTVYDVIQTPFGPECDCADFIFRRDGLDPRGCKHVQALVSVGMIEGHDSGEPDR